MKQCKNCKHWKQINGIWGYCGRQPRLFTSAHNSYNLKCHKKSVITYIKFLLNRYKLF